MDWKALVQTEEYDFLRTRERLGKNLMLVGLGGSYAYGTNNENSDLDLRGITMQLPSDLIGLTEFEQYTDDKTDTVIYGFNKMVRLLLECNPNTCELLGLEEDQYLIKTRLGQELIDHAGIFFSRKAVRSFKGFADAQFRRFQNAIARDSLPQSDKEEHILKSVMHALEDFQQKNSGKDDGEIRLSIDKAVTPGFEREIFVDAKYTHVPLREYSEMWGTMRAVVRDYDKVSKTRLKKDENHLNKHAMHLIRLHMMAIDLLEQGKIITYRGKDLPLLLAIRRGDYCLEDGTYSREFYEILEEYQRRLEEAARSTILPERPDMQAVERFVEKVNRSVITG